MANNDAIYNTEKFTWFLYGMIFCSIIHLITGVSPDTAKSNIIAWVHAYEGKSHE